MKGVPDHLSLTLRAGVGCGVRRVQSMRTPGHENAHSEPVPELSFKSPKSERKYSRVNVAFSLTPTC